MPRWRTSPRTPAPDARAWVLLEDEGRDLVVSVRDDGLGFAAGAARAGPRRGPARRGVVDRGPGPRPGRDDDRRVGARCGHRGRAAGAEEGIAVTRVMVVDDHPMWRDAVARDLAEAGHDVVATAADGGEAVRRAPAARPEVVVLDLQLPVHVRRRGHPRAGRRRPDGAGAGALGERRARGRAGGRQGGRHRLPGEVGVPRRAAVGRRADRARGGGLHAGARGAGAGGVPPAVVGAGRVVGRRTRRGSPTARPRCCGWWPRG